MATRRDHRDGVLTHAGGRISCFGCDSRHQSAWCDLSDEDFRILNQVKVSNVYQPGQFVFHQGHPCLGIYVVETGTVAVRKSDAQGNSVLVRLAHAGDTMGYRAFFAATAYSTSAEALAPTRACFVDKVAVQGFLERNPAIALRFLARLAKELEDSEEARLHAVALSVRARLAHLLLLLRDRFAQVSDEGTMTIQLPLSRQDMADMVGTRPETIARTIRALTDDGVARFEGRRVVVPDLDVLMNEVEDPARLS